MKRSGFTLIELLTVLLIAGTLSIIAFSAIDWATPPKYVEGLVTKKYSTIFPDYGKVEQIEVLMSDEAIETYLSGAYHDQIHPNQYYRLRIRGNSVTEVQNIQNISQAEQSP